MTRVDEDIRVVLERTQDGNIIRRACAEESAQVLVLERLFTVEHLAYEPDQVAHSALVEISVEACEIAISRHSPHSICNLSGYELGVVEDHVLALVLYFSLEVEGEALDWD